VGWGGGGGGGGGNPPKYEQGSSRNAGRKVYKWIKRTEGRHVHYDHVNLHFISLERTM